jgi:hypothetical protein
VQGQLRQEPLAVAIETACGHCGRPLHLTVSSDMRVKVHDQGADPLVFMPQIDWSTFTESDIIDAY